MPASLYTGNHGVLRSIGKGLAHAAGADYAHHCAGEDGHKNSCAGRKGQESV